MQIPLTNTYGTRIGHIEIDDQYPQLILDTTPHLELGYLVRDEMVEKFVLRVDVEPHG